MKRRKITSQPKYYIGTGIGEIRCIPPMRYSKIDEEKSALNDDGLEVFKFTVLSATTMLRFTHLEKINPENERRAAVREEDKNERGPHCQGHLLSFLAFFGIFFIKLRQFIVISLIINCINEY